MTDLYLLEPPLSIAWFPFQDCRPVAELRAGAWLIRERWEAVADAETRQLFGPTHLHGFVEDGVPEVTGGHAVRGPALIGRSDFAPAGVRPNLPAGPARLTHDGAVVGWSVPEGVEWREGPVDWPGVEIDGLLLRGAFDLITALELLLAPDAADLTVESGDALPDGCVVIGEPSDVVLLGATVEPGVTFDVREGAVVVERRAYVKGGTRFEGPVYVGPGTEVHGGQIRASAIGPRCKVRGEISSSVFLGYANKVHDGFVGHSVVGRWTNLGAGTTTSNLKSTYGPVRLSVGADTIETERAYLGSLIGDHAKTAIGTLLQTGAVIGTGASLFCDHRAPKYVAPFAWGGDSAARMQREGFLATAARVLERRKVPMTDDVRRMLERIYHHATGAA
jgi:UDP-N-acetylglucosamine diphosphorylase/glucosamine-1-phosphate N-acetyltransferase